MDMQVTWTGAEATELRRFLGVTQSKFSKITGVGVPTVEKWAQRGAWVTLSEDFARIMDTTLARATAEQQAQFAAAIGLDGRGPEPGAVATVWRTPDSADCVTATAEPTRKDLTMDRRHATQALLEPAVQSRRADRIRSTALDRLGPAEARMIQGGGVPGRP